MGYILVDFDRTLASYTGWESQREELGDPIPAMLERVQRWLHSGRDVRIFTARVGAGGDRAKVEREKVEGWCVEHLGRALPVQNWKDFECEAIWDDLAITVDPNTGYRLTSEAGDLDPLTSEEEWELMAHHDTDEEKFSETE